MLYSSAVRLNNMLYDRRLRAVRHAAVPVISVGNISTGGSGKSPFVQMLVREALAMKARPAVISRGYKRSGSGEVVVSDGASILATSAESGDELMMHAALFPIPVIANAKRVEGARTAVERFGANLIILDDGFQHRALHRDMDIVIIDEFTLRQKALLPFGRLREPWSALKRATVIALHEGISPQDIPANIDHALIIGIRTEWNGVYKLTKAGLRAGNSTNNSTIQLPKQLLAVSAIAHPARFEATLAKEGILPVKHCTFADHHAYTRADCSTLITECKQANAQAIITTEKDAVKLISYLDEFQSHGIDVLCVSIRTVIADKRDEFLGMMNALTHP